MQGAPANVGHTVSRQTVGNILKANGIQPVPQRKRKTTWETFLKAHWDSVAAIDFTTTEVWTLQSLMTVFMLVVINLKTRRIEIAGVTAHPDSVWVQHRRMRTRAEFDGRMRLNPGAGKTVTSRLSGIRSKGDVSSVNASQTLRCAAVRTSWKHPAKEYHYENIRPASFNCDLCHRFGRRCRVEDIEGWHEAGKCVPGI